MRFFRRNPTEPETAIPDQPNIGPLSRQIAQAFSRDEVRDLCFDLSIDPDEMPEKAKTEQCTWLIKTLQRAGHLPEFLSLLQERRPQYDWQKPIVPTPKDLRNRDNLLQNVKTIWIEGFLHQSLSQTITLELNLSYQPEAIARKSLYTPGENPEASIEQPLQEVFQKHGRSLLILGEPGSGKTITLLQLAETLITAAQHDPSQPVPVILNLSSWAQQKQPLQEWLVEELFLQYDMSRKLSKTWITQNLLLYLLDGLDEVAAEARDACIQTINNFKAEHPAELVVCSRLADYDELQEKLNVATAVRLHPLTDDQIQTYLSHPELELTAVRDALATDLNLNELAHSPLFLNIMTLAYRGFTREQVQSFGTLANRRKHLFDTYVDEMFRRRPLSSDQKAQIFKHIFPVIDKDQAHEWLVNLAHGMVQHDQSVFYIDRLQPSWIVNSFYRKFYFSTLMSTLLTISALLIIGVSHLISWLYLGFYEGEFYSLVSGALIGFLLGFLKSKRFVFLTIFLGGIISVSITQLIYYANKPEIFTLLNLFDFSIADNPIVIGIETVPNLISGLLISFYLWYKFMHQDIQPTDKIDLSWKKMVETWLAGILSIFVIMMFKNPTMTKLISDFFENSTWVILIVLNALAIGTLFTIISAIHYRNLSIDLLSSKLRLGVTIGLLSYIFELVFFRGGLIAFVIISGLISGVVDKTIEVKTSPNQGIHTSFFRSLILALMIGIAFASVTFIHFFALFPLAHTVVENLKTGVYFGSISLIVAFILGGMVYGGLSVLQHSILRIAILGTRLLPLNLRLFLDSMVKIIFLKRVGGGWVFIHRSLLEYFAALHPDAQPPAGSVQYDNLDTNLREV